MPKRIMESPLDEALDTAGVTGGQLAERLGITASEVSRYRRKKVTPLRAMQERIAKELSCVPWVSVASLWPRDEG
jgi:transcriptional regulator with XRE-family HTH domain